MGFIRAQQGSATSVPCLSPFPVAGLDFQAPLEAAVGWIWFCHSSFVLFCDIFCPHPSQGYDDTYADQSYEGYEGYYSQGQG